MTTASVINKAVYTTSEACLNVSNVHSTHKHKGVNKVALRPLHHESCRLKVVEAGVFRQAYGRRHLACRAVQMQKEDKVVRPDRTSHTGPSHPGHSNLNAEQNGASTSGKSGAEGTGEQVKEAEVVEGSGESISGGAVAGTSVVAGAVFIGLLVGLGALGYVYKDQINDNIGIFSQWIEEYGAFGYVLFVAGYAGLEILAIPAIPLTMSAGLLFGTLTGTILVSIAGTLAATASFLIARYVARDRIMEFAKGNKKFMAIDKAIGRDSFRVVTLLRLSPLLPFSLGNYIYGLTSVELMPYIAGSWLGMLPGTWAYVSAGSFGRSLLAEESSGLHGTSLVTLGIGIAATVIAGTYVTRIAKDAVKDIENE
eukprot:jgi/Mesen1/2352/ME000156S01496